MNAPVQIRNAEVIRDIRQLAERTHLPITEAVGQAVRAQIERLEADKAAEVDAMIADVKALVRRFNALPTVGPMLTDDDLYDEWGFAEVITVDASALLAIILEEPDQDTMLEAIKAAGSGMISPVNWWEVAVKARIVKSDQGLLIAEAILRRLNIRIAAVDAAQANAAFDAHVRFGRGTPAALNLGDCFAYALAKQEGGGLLFKGEDFPKTDIRSALG